MANEKKLVVVHRLHQILVPFMLRRQVCMLCVFARDCVCVRVPVCMRALLWPINLLAGIAKTIVSAVRK